MICQITKREICLVLLVFVAYFAPSTFRDAVFEKVFPEYSAMHGNTKFAEDLRISDIPVSNVMDYEEDNDPSIWNPPLPEKTTLGLYHNGLDLVHTIHTRFMQYQPELKSLGRARIELFKTFTLPSVMQQSDKEFLWIIWMEPQLNTDLRSEFLDLVQSIPNCVVIGSRAKMPYIRSEFFPELMESSVYSGSYELLMDYHEASLTRTVLHTELDADDALYYDFVRGLQRDAHESLAQSHLKYDYRLWCVRKHLTWGWYNPWNEQAEQGYLLGKESKKECPSGGYTKGYGAMTEDTDLPKQSRHEVHSKTPQCDFTEHKCIARIFGGASEFAVLRSRTPTAHGMTDVMPKNRDPKMQTSPWKNKQEDLWKRLPKSYGVNNTTVMDMRARLEEDMVNIILENLEGQCKDGFSCKHSTKDHLKELKKKYKKPIEEDKLRGMDGGVRRIMQELASKLSSFELFSSENEETKT